MTLVRNWSAIKTLRIECNKVSEILIVTAYMSVILQKFESIAPRELLGFKLHTTFAY